MIYHGRIWESVQNHLEQTQVNQNMKQQRISSNEKKGTVARTNWESMFFPKHSVSVKNTFVKLPATIGWLVQCQNPDIPSLYSPKFIGILILAEIIPI